MTLIILCQKSIRTYAAYNLTNILDYLIGERYNGAPIYAFLNLKLNQDKSSPDEGEITITVQDFIHGNWLYDGYFLSFVGKPNKSELAEHIKGICGRYNFTLIEKL